MANLKNTTVDDRFVLPKGNTLQRQFNSNYALRYNTEINRFEYFYNGGWKFIENRPSVASGGIEKTFIIDSLPFKIHTFQNTGNQTFTLFQQTSCDILLVGGGGAGSSSSPLNAGGGGGAGGFVYYKNKTLDAGTYQLSVGSGGPSGFVDGAGENGDSTSFETLISAVGGGGGGRQDASGRSGGSGGGGGGGGSGGNGGAGTVNQGNSGGNSNNPSGSPFNGAGGGGAAEPGTRGGAITRAQGGNGFIEGDEVYNFTNGTFVSFEIDSTGRSFAGGGGGATRIGVRAVPAIGGGGVGGYARDRGGFGVGAPGNGKPNTGGGGGGSQTFDSLDFYHTSGAGGSGIIIVKYQL